ncbi:MAG: HAMP domain-containing sensor histidine kinase [Candidatus Acidiferrum sp.]
MAAIVILGTAVVIVLGALQYRWSNQVSEATSIRLADSLYMSMINWHLDFFRDFSEICTFMRDDSEVDAHADWSRYARQLSDWKKSTAHPELVSKAYILNMAEGQDHKILQLDPASMSFKSADFPFSWDEFRLELRAASSEFSSLPDLRSRDSRSEDGAGEFAGRFYSSDPLQDWRFEPRIPALVRPLMRAQNATTASGYSGEVDWLVIVLNRATIQDQILPSLAQRYFQGTDGLDYQVAVITGKDAKRVMYSSDPPFGAHEITDADGRMDIFGRRQDKLSESPIRIFHAPSEKKGPATSVGIAWFLLLSDQDDEQDWSLIVRHRRGGALGSFVADSRRRDLTLSFGVLFLLVISMAILISTSIRAQRLAKLQMDFVTAVSHELRSPLTVISSAAENIAQGVVEGKEQLEQYGSVIGAQAKKLFEMVEQVLLFASTREGHQRYNLRPLEVSSILEAALSSTAELIHAAGFRVDQKVPSNLPQVLGDLPALSQCLQNLITNALKYGGGECWIGIDVRHVENGLSARAIQISVTDRGMGIDAHDLLHIFEPFYRSATVAAAQIHGTGLGLPLVRSITESMGGHVSVTSVLGQGSTFTMHLPCLNNAARETSAKGAEAISS